MLFLGFEPGAAGLRTTYYHPATFNMRFIINVFERFSFKIRSSGIRKRSFRKNSPFSLAWIVKYIVEILWNSSTHFLNPWADDVVNTF